MKLTFKKMSFDFKFTHKIFNFWALIDRYIN